MIEYIIVGILLTIAYLVGSIPFSVIIGKLFKGIDIRQHGSGNPGTTNAFRVLGKRLGMLVFFFDVLKGGIVVLIVRTNLFGLDLLGEAATLIHPIIYGFFAALGHVYPIFIKFKGGKAVATSVGVYAFYAPALAIFAFFTYIIVLKKTRYVSLASCSAAIAMVVQTILVYFFAPISTDQTSLLTIFIGEGKDLLFPFVTILIALFIIYRHVNNFKNIKAGTEPKANFMRKKSPVK